MFIATPQIFLRRTLLLGKFSGSVAPGRQGAQLSGNREGTDLVLADRLDDGLLQLFAAKDPDPIDELCQSLFARITETVIAHETEDWPGYYDRLCGVACRVVAHSDLPTRSKGVLTRRLIQHIIELEKWWPRLKPE